MRVLVYAINHAPEIIGIGKYVGEMVAWLTANGHEVRVVVAPPYYPSWRVSTGYSAWRYRTEHRDGATVYRCPLYVPKRPTPLRRVIHLMSFALTSLPVALWQGLFWRPDVVFVVEPPLACAPTAWLAARLARAKAWLHIQDFEADVAFELGLIESPLLHSLVKYIECHLMRRFDVVSAISLQMCERLLRKGVRPHRIELFENGVDTEAMHPLEGPSPMRSELGIEDGTMVALYAGNIGEKQGLDTLIGVARQLAGRRDILFLLAGEGGMLARLETEAEDLDNFRILPLQPLSRFNDLLNLADVHLLPQRRDAADLVMPSKLLGMLASGRPVIAGAMDGTAVATMVEGRGLIVEPENTMAMAAAIETLADDPERRLALGQAARELAVKRLNKDVTLSRFLDIIEGSA